MGLSIAIHAVSLGPRDGYKLWHKRFDAGEITVWEADKSLPVYQVRGMVGLEREEAE
ncbi:MAG: hypothetical protein ACLFVU_12320 [Phycisphaerae bacterium]